MFRVVLMSVVLYGSMAVAGVCLALEVFFWLMTGTWDFISMSDWTGPLSTSWDGLNALIWVYLATPLWLMVPATGFVVLLLLAQGRKQHEQEQSR